MPTGFTADVANGKITELPEFLKVLARGMGFLILMRDEPHEAPIPEAFTPNSYHAERVAEAKTALSDLSHMLPDELDAAAQKEFDAEHRGWAQRRLERAAQQARYENLIAGLEAWTPTHEAMVGLRRFGLEQLRESLRHDCATPEIEARYYPEPKLLTPDEWRLAKVAAAEHDIEYHSKENVKEVERTNMRNECLTVFREELAALAKASTEQSN